MALLLQYHHVSPLILIVEIGAHLNLLPLVDDLLDLLRGLYAGLRVLLLLTILLLLFLLDQLDQRLLLLPQLFDQPLVGQHG
jgi:hypothetical protein